jgi:hypothetical protein
MSIEQMRAAVIASVWQAVAQSGVDLSALPQDQQEKLVTRIADNLLVTVNGILDDVPRPEPEPAEQAGKEDELSEKIYWQGRPFLSLVESYVLTSERIKIVKGLLGRDVENFELIRVQDIDLKQHVGERMLGIGDITVRGSDQSKPAIVLRNVSKPEEVYEIMRRAWLEARKRHGLQFREYM